MEPNATSAPMYYNSFYRHGVDEKRRVQIPAKWRPTQDGFEFTLIVWPQAPHGTCLRVLPPEQMAALARYLEALPKDDPKRPRLKRLIGSGSIQAALDKVGRICLPEGMAKEAGITSEAMLVGAIDYFEIWSPENYEQVKAADALMAPDAFKLMG